jgi:hypothetical protein
MEHNSAEYLHTLVEALRFIHLYAPFNLEFVLMPVQRLAFAGDSPPCSSVGIFRDCLNLDSQHYATDPDLEYVPVKDLLDKVY